MTTEERNFMELAIREARKSVAEDSRVHPQVGVVVVKDGTQIAMAYRGEVPSAHAEFVVLEEKLRDATVAGATVYTTLEPCTTRNHPKVPCVKRLIERKVGRVVIGMLDPDPRISGKGQLMLREANIAIDVFPKDLMEQIEELNREFIRSCKELPATARVEESFITANTNRDLDEWYRTINHIYWNRNFYRGTASIFTHLVEVVGGLSLLASDKKKKGVLPENFLPKAFAWWMSLCGKLGVKSVADMVWRKFPSVCPYCLETTHKPQECLEIRSARPGPDWEALGRFAAERAQYRPTGLPAWQRLFAVIYPPHQTESYGSIFARLMEELGELSEAIRVFTAAPGYLLSEAADVFAWLMHLQNLIELRQGIRKAEQGISLARALCMAYPDRCLYCNSLACTCPPILTGTVGRIAHEVPTSAGSFSVGGSFMTPDMPMTVFHLSKL